MQDFLHYGKKKHAMIHFKNSRNTRINSIVHHSSFEFLIWIIFSSYFILKSTFPERICINHNNLSVENLANTHFTSLHEIYDHQVSSTSNKCLRSYIQNLSGISHTYLWKRWLFSIYFFLISNTFAHIFLLWDKDSSVCDNQPLASISSFSLSANLHRLV